MIKVINEIRYLYKLNNSQKIRLTIKHLGNRIFD